MNFFMVLAFLRDPGYLRLISILETFGGFLGLCWDLKNCVDIILGHPDQMNHLVKGILKDSISHLKSNLRWTQIPMYLLM